MILDFTQNTVQLLNIQIQIFFFNHQLLGLFFKCVLCFFSVCKGIAFTSHAEVQFLHNDVILEIWVPSEVEANPVAKFGVFETFNLRRTPGKT